MDRVIGWFWKSNSQNNTTEEQSTDEKKKQEKEHKLANLPKEEKLQANLDKNNNTASVTKYEDVKEMEPVLISDKTKSSTNFMHFLQKYTYLQPEDCVFCKLTATGCATLLYISGISNFRNQRKAFRNQKVMTFSRNAITLFQYGIITALLGIFLQKEWYNALTKPPGEEPRSFLKAMQAESGRLRPPPTGQKHSEKENEK